MNDMSSLLHRIGQFWALRPEAKRFAVAAWLGAPWVELALATLGLRRTLALAERVGPERASESAWQKISVEEGERLVRAAYSAHFVRGRCLPQSVLQYALHRLDGAPVRFVIGIRREPQTRLDAHAWIESEGETRNAGFGSILVSDLRRAAPGGAP